MQNSSPSDQAQQKISDGFTLNSPATSHHSMKLRSQTHISPVQPNIIPPDHPITSPFNTAINSYPTKNYPISQPNTSAHLLPPDPHYL